MEKLDPKMENLIDEINEFIFIIKDKRKHNKKKRDSIKLWGFHHGSEVDQRMPFIYAKNVINPLNLLRTREIIIEGARKNYINLSPWNLSSAARAPSRSGPTDSKRNIKS